MKKKKTGFTITRKRFVGMYFYDKNGNRTFHPFINGDLFSDKT